MKPTADQEQIASVLAMELSSLMFFFDHFPKITQTQVDQMLNKEGSVKTYLSKKIKDLYRPAFQNFCASEISLG